MGLLYSDHAGSLNAGMSASNASAIPGRKKSSITTCENGCACSKLARSPGQSMSLLIMRGLTRAAIVISADARRIRPPRGARGARRLVFFPAAVRGAEEPRLGGVRADLACESLTRAQFRRAMACLGHAHSPVDWLCGHGRAVRGGSRRRMPGPARCGAL